LKFFISRCLQSALRNRMPSLPLERVATLTGAHGDGAILAARFAHTGEYVVTCGRDRSFALWNARRGACVKKYTGGHSREVRDASCARDGSKIATCGGDRGVFLWDVATGASVRRWSGHEGEGGVNAVELCGAGDSACASAGYDASVKMWDTRSNSAMPMQTIHARTGVAFGDSVTSLSVDAEGYRIACGCVDGVSRVVDLRNGKCHMDVIGAPVTSVRYSNDRRYLLVGCLTSRVATLDAKTGDSLATYRGHRSERSKTECAWTPDDAHVVSGSEDGRVLFWDVVTAEIAAELPAHDPKSVVTAIDFAPTRSAASAESLMVTSGTDGVARVWSSAAQQG
jgi:mitogen-activated protein kinase organizer 1